MDYDKELNKIDELIDKLSDIAVQDGRVSRDEQKLLDSIFSDLGEYRSILLDAGLDDIITEEEKSQIKQHKDNILANASKIAIDDGTYSEDEQQLIESIIEFVGSKK